jgi:hypothetical protein
MSMVGPPGLILQMKYGVRLFGMSQAVIFTVWLAVHPEIVKKHSKQSSLTAGLANAYNSIVVKPRSLVLDNRLATPFDSYLGLCFTAEAEYSVH